MKNLRLNIMTLVIIVLTVTACSKDDDSNPSQSNDTSAQQVSNIAQSGTWRITYFWDTDEDETNNFTGYEFKFNSDGSLIATKGNTTVTGSWSVVDDSSNSSTDDDGNSTDDDDFNILFNVPTTSDFDDLIDDWDIISVSNTKIELTDVSGGNGGTDFLTFEKN
ncbi:MAG: hypothetical protein AAFP76_10280 [Bacteroidota bacterium]